MIKKLFVLLFVFPFIVEAKALQVAGQDYLIHGGVTGTFQFHSHSASNIDALGSAINDLIVGLSSQSQNVVLSVDGAIGNLQRQDFFYTTAPSPPMDIGLLYGWLNLRPNSYMHMELGLIETRSSYESSVSFENTSVTMGATKRTQAAYYTGFRLNTRLPGVPVRAFAEFSAPENASTTQVSAGLDWRGQQNYFSLNYQLSEGEKSTINSHARLRLHAVLSMGFNIDYHTAENYPDHLNANAYGIAGYFVLYVKNLSLPLRAEITDDGDTVIYGLGRSYSLTFSPTVYLDKHTMLRVDGFYAQSSTKPFKDERGFVNSQIGATLQLAWRF